MDKSPRILAVDVGNTSVLFADISAKGIKKTFRVTTQNASRPKAMRDLKKIFDLRKMDAVVIAGVVPLLVKSLASRISSCLGVKTIVLGKDIPVPVANRYRNPKQVGIDRLVNAFAAVRKYGTACVIVDFGTAITFDVVSKKGEYLGGVIAPGIEISLEALFQKTALLPKVRLRHPRGGVIGRDTVESIRLGCSIGIGGLCDHLTLKLKKELGPKTLVIATGGYAPFMKRYCKTINFVDPNLTIRGVWLAYQAFIQKNP